METERVHALLLESLQHERGGVEIYSTAVGLAQNEDLRHEWEEYLQQTHKHVEVLTGVVEAFGLDPAKQTPGTEVVHHMGAALVEAMQMAQRAGDAATAELVAAECVVLAETKDHLNWEIMGEIAQALSGHEGKALKAACDEVEGEEDRHLYHNVGWTRELWLDCLALPAVLPPPEEEKDVTTAIGAARAKQTREEML